jgi:nucleoside 2-deoxyribosyltransferase
MITQGVQMKIFLACPVRNINDEFREAMEIQVKLLESQGHQVHWPPRDTDQHDPVGMRIFKDNRKAIEEADAVYVIWDGKSQGVLFDLGIAFALRKPIHTVKGYMPAPTHGKSIQNVVYAWEEGGAK